MSGRQLTEIPPEVFRYTGLKKLILSDNQIKVIPGRIRFFNALTHLDLSRNSIQELPKQLFELRRLNYLNLTGNLLKTLAPEIDLLTNLDVLKLGNNALEKLPENLCLLPELKELDVDYNKIPSLPKQIGQLTNLKKISLAGNQLKRLPVSFRKLSRIRYLKLTDNQLTKFPTSVRYLKELRTLYLRPELLASAPVQLAQLTNLAILPIAGTSKDRRKAKWIMELLEATRSEKSTFRKSMFYLLEGGEKVASIPTGHLIRGLEICPEMICQLAEEELANRFPAAIKPKDSIFIVGKLNTTKEQLKARLAKLDIQIEEEFQPEVNHVVLGKGASKNLPKALSDDINLMTGLQLQKQLDHLDPPYLLQPESQQSVTHLSELLLSENEAHILLGLEILESGGMPEELQTDLFLLANSKHAPEIVGRSKKMLAKKMLPASLLLKIHPIPLYQETITEYELSNLLELYAEEGLDVLKMAFHILGVTGKGRYYLLQKSKADWKVEILQRLISGNRLDLSNADLDQLPAVLSEFTQLRHLDLSNNRLQTFPKQLRALINLESLLLCQNYIGEIPSWIKELKHLKFLELDELSRDGDFSVPS